MSDVEAAAEHSGFVLTGIILRALAIPAAITTGILWLTLGWSLAT